MNSGKEHIVKPWKSLETLYDETQKIFETFWEVFFPERYDTSESHRYTFKPSAISI